MCPVRVSVVAPIDSRGNLPGEFDDLSLTAWRELLNATLKMSEYDDPTTLPVIVRPTDLFRAGAELLLLPRMRRPVIRFSGGGDPPGFSPEWSSVESGYYHLCSGALGKRPIHLWIVGHAWLCMMGLRLRAPKTLYVSEIGGGRPFENGVRLLKQRVGPPRPDNGNQHRVTYDDLAFAPLAPDCLKSKWPLHMFKYTNLSSKDEIFAVSDSNEDIPSKMCGIKFPSCCIPI